MNATICLCGDVMTSRGIVWGSALEELGRRAPDARIASLSLTHAENVRCLAAARLDICALANNHAIDIGERRHVETLDVVRGAGIELAGVGRSIDEARRPAAVRLPGGGRVLVFSMGTGDGGVPWTWQATASRPGIDFLADLSEIGAAQVIERVRRAKRPGDIVVASIHWGSNWGYEVPAEHIRFAHRLVEGGVDVVHGHSSHHPRPVEVWRRKLILYGCGDLIGDCQGTPGYAAFRDDLVLMYFAKLDAANGDLTALEMVPMLFCNMQLQHASFDDARWIAERLTSISEPLGSTVSLSPDTSVLELARAKQVVTGGPMTDARLDEMLATPHAV